MNRRIQLVTATMSLALATGGLAACSGSSKSGTTATTTAAASASGSAAAPGSAGARGGAFSDPKVTACLKAAGITIPTGTRRSGAFPSGSRGSFSRPSGGFPSGSRPSGAPGGGGFGGNSAQSKKIQAALKACGITLPTGGRRAGGSGAPATATPTPSAS